MSDGKENRSTSVSHTDKNIFVLLLLSVCIRSETQTNPNFVAILVRRAVNFAKNNGEARKPKSRPMAPVTLCLNFHTNQIVVLNFLSE